MGRINVLDTRTANAIKAGEVIERPVSVVKELIDNSVDAGATNIRIDFEGGGISLIRVSDNGCGMDAEDARKSFLIHATSKIKSAEDIYDLSTQGFRGEALASIAACSDVTLVTRQADMRTAIKIEYHDGDMVSESEVGADTGTVVTVTGLFANIPARYKFLKRDATESMYICTLVEKLAIINPHISFRLTKDGKNILSTPGSGSMEDAIYAVYGREITSGLVKLDYRMDGGIRLEGFASKPSCVRGNRGLQYVYVNGRPIRNASVTAAIDEAYKAAVMKHKYPICFLAVYVPPQSVDVNVHPQKAEVKFSDEREIFRLVYHGIKSAVFDVPRVSGISDVSDVSDDKKPDLTVVSHETPVKPAAKSTGNGQQLKINTVSSTFTSSDSQATDRLLKILSGFKPDIAEISGEDEEGAEVSSPTPEQKNAIQTVTEPTGEIAEMLGSEFIGFLFSTYIVLQSEEAVFVVDQHAAHERVLYERFSGEKMKPQDEKRLVETLLVPQVIELSSADMSFVTDNIDKFREIGFDIDPVGQRELALRSVPSATKAEDRLKSMSKPSVMFMSVLNDMKRDVPEKGEVWTSLIQTTACKAAIKAHDRISQQEAMSLIEQLALCKDPYHCAHGRPTFKRIPLSDIEKSFKRIV